MDIMGGAGGRFWGVGAVQGGYGDVRYLRKGESRGGFRSAAENDGQAGGVTCGAGMMRIREWWAGTPRASPRGSGYPRCQGIANAPLKDSFA